MNKKRIILILVILVIFFSIAIFGYFFYQKKQDQKNSKILHFQAVKIIDTTCENCFDTNIFIDLVKKDKVILDNIREVDINSDEGKELKNKYKIVKAPIVLLKGEYDENNAFIKNWQSYGEVIDDALVSDVYPPYRDLKTNEIIGQVDLTIIYNQQCTNCYNTKLQLAYLKADGLVPNSINKLDVLDPEAQDLIKKYNIKKVPTIILSPEAKYYKKLTTDWQGVGFIAADGNYIFTAVEQVGDYYDLEQSKEVNIQN